MSHKEGQDLTLSVLAMYIVQALETKVAAHSTISNQSTNQSTKQKERYILIHERNAFD